MQLFFDSSERPRKERITTTVYGSFDIIKISGATLSRSVELQNIQLSEFVNSRVVGGVETRLFYFSECRYDKILGRDFLRSAKIKFCFHTNIINWLGFTLDMNPVDDYMIEGLVDIGLQPRGFYKENTMEMCYSINEELEDSEMFQSTEGLDRAYSSVTATEPKQGRTSQPSREGSGQVQNHF